MTHRTTRGEGNKPTHRTTTGQKQQTDPPKKRGEKQQADPPNNKGRSNKMTHRTGRDDHVVEPKAREKELKEDQIFGAYIDVTFRHGGGQDDQGQGVFGKKNSSLYCVINLEYFFVNNRSHVVQY
jgi:hypothetical protein